MKMGKKEVIVKKKLGKLHWRLQDDHVVMGGGCSFLSRSLCLGYGTIYTVASQSPSTVYCIQCWIRSREHVKIHASITRLESR